jgi:DNA-binding MarR family transcriptional regulator
MNHEISYRVMKIIEERPEISQRELAEALGISLGKTNYCLKALIEKGLIKVRITAAFLKHKLAEYDELKREIATLQQEVADAPPAEDEPN